MSTVLQSESIDLAIESIGQESRILRESPLLSKLSQPTVLGGFALFLNTWGLLNTFGVFQIHYASTTTASASAISWIGSTQATLLLVIGAITGPIYDRGHLVALLACGTTCIFLGHVFLSLSTQYYQILVSQGLLNRPRRGLPLRAVRLGATSLLQQPAGARDGAGRVGLLGRRNHLPWYAVPAPPSSRLRLGRAHHRLRGAGHPRASARRHAAAHPPARPRALVDRAACTDLHYCLFVGASLLAFMGLFVLLFYISFAAEERRIATEHMAFYIVPILNAASCFGRTLSNALADRLGPFNLIAPCCLVVAGCLFAMVGVRTLGGLVGVALVAGFFSGALIGLPPLCFVGLTADQSMIGTRMGMGFGIIGLG
ncbi:MFS general substrate transporter, partial [Aspergillus brunneoviolaceus CBS 621.78]